MGIQALSDTYGALFTHPQEKPFEDAVADLAISILKAKRKPPQRPKKNELAPIAYALADVCVIDFKANSGKLFAEAKRLLQATPKPTSHLIRLHYGRNGTWYTENHWGRQGKSPHLGQVRLTWAKIVGKVLPSLAKPGTPVPYSDEWYEQQMERDVQAEAFR